MMKKNMAIFFIAGCFGLLSGCSTGIKVGFNGKTEQQYFADKVACQKASTSYQGGTYNKYTGYIGGGDTINNDMVIDCLRSKGYSVQRQ